MLSLPPSDPSRGVRVQVAPAGHGLGFTAPALGSAAALAVRRLGSLGSSQLNCWLLLLHCSLSPQPLPCNLNDVADASELNIQLKLVHTVQ